MPKQKIGAFWKKVLVDGRVVYGGHIVLADGNKINVNLWVNDKQDNPKRPDLVAYLDTFVAPIKQAPLK